MTSPVLALRAAIRAACAADAMLATLMEVAIHDDVPRAALAVYATFGTCELRDASTSTERGHEQEVEIVVWAKRGSAASALAAAERLSALLDGASPQLAGHRLISLAVSGLDVGQDEASASARIAVRLRAVTEALP